MKCKLVSVEPTYTLEGLTKRELQLLIKIVANSVGKGITPLLDGLMTSGLHFTDSSGNPFRATGMIRVTEVEK